MLLRDAVQAEGLEAQISRDSIIEDSRTRAVHAITVSLSQELGPQKIRVNALNPGMVETDGLRASGFHESAFREHQERETPLGRIGQSDDIALAPSFLAGDDARWISGQVIVAAGGKRM